MERVVPWGSCCAIVAVAPGPSSHGSSWAQTDATRWWPSERPHQASRLEPTVLHTRTGTGLPQTWMATTGTTAPVCPPGSTDKRRTRVRLRRLLTRNTPRGLRYRSPAAAQRRLLARLEDRLAGFVSAPPVVSLRLFRGMPAQLRHPYGAGWALVGDAGWWKDPLSTHGITDAFRDAELLATAVIADASSERAGAIALAGYQAQRDRIAWPMHGIVDRLASHEWDLTGGPPSAA